MDYLTVTKLTDPIEHRIPTGKAEEVAREPTWLDAVDALICRELMNSAGDAVANIPTAEAREVMPPTAQRIVCKNIGEAFGEMIRRDLREGILRDLFGAHWEKKRTLAVSAENTFCAPEELADPNAAMIARDGKSAKPHWVNDKVWSYGGFVGSSCQEPKPGVRPAITGLTTVHDGKERGLGFCCE